MDSTLRAEEVHTSLGCGQELSLIVNIRSKSKTEKLGIQRDHVLKEELVTENSDLKTYLHDPHQAVLIAT